jgi:hypothetical protein
VPVLVLPVGQDLAGHGHGVGGRGQFLAVHGRRLLSVRVRAGGITWSSCRW